MSFDDDLCSHIELFDPDEPSLEEVVYNLLSYIKNNKNNISTKSIYNFIEKSPYTKEAVKNKISENKKMQEEIGEIYKSFIIDDSLPMESIENIYDIYEWCDIPPCFDDLKQNPYDNLATSFLEKRLSNEEFLNKIKILHKLNLMPIWSGKTLIDIYSQLFNEKDINNPDDMQWMKNAHAIIYRKEEGFNLIIKLIKGFN